MPFQNLFLVFSNMLLFRFNIYYVINKNCKIRNFWYSIHLILIYLLNEFIIIF